MLAARTIAMDWRGIAPPSLRLYDPFESEWSLGSDALQSLGSGATLLLMPVDAPVNTPTDEALAASAAARDASPSAYADAQTAFTELHARHSRLLRAFLSTRMPRSDVDDAEAVIWTRIWTVLPTQFQGGNFRAWLYQIARNHLIDLSRRNRHSQLDDGQPVVDRGSRGPVALMLEEERMQLLKQCLERLQPELAQIFSARLSGESYDDICERMQLPMPKAHRLLFMAKQQLTTCVGRGQ